MATRLKPLRDVDQHDVIPFFALASASGDKGQLVTIQGSGFVNGWNLTAENLFSVPNTVNWRWSVPWKVRLATSGEGAGEVLGLLLNNVRETNQWGESMIYRERYAAEADAVPSGMACNIATRGYFLVSGAATGAFSAAGPMSGAQAHNSSAGDWAILGRNDTNTIGRYLGGPDANGFALFFLNL